ncbi:MAG: hypothetical protein EBZ45_03805, partial [Actinobacteria bacterium]|nr:hypothetical protein [Actinomycetota bacterium]
DYLSSVLEGATKLQRDGVDAFEAARELVSMLHGTSKPFSSMGEFGRMAVNVDTVYRSLDPTYQPPNVVEQFRRMAVIEGDVVEVSLDALESTPSDDPRLAPVAEPTLSSGPHLSYTVQWILFSICAIAAWALLVRRALHQKDSSAQPE